MLEHSSTTRPVQQRTEEFRKKQNPTILPTDGHPPFHPSTSTHLPNPPTQPSQPSLPLPTLSRSRQPTWAETTHLPMIPPAPGSQPSLSQPLQSTFESPTMSHSLPTKINFQEQGSSGSGHQGSRSPSSSRKIQSVQERKNKRIGRYHCDHPGCSSTSSSAKSFKRHELLHQTPNPKAKCGHCGKQMSRMDAVLRHERICKGQSLPELAEFSPESEEEDSP